MGSSSSFNSWVVSIPSSFLATVVISFTVAVANSSFSRCFISQYFWNVVSFGSFHWSIISTSDTSISSPSFVVDVPQALSTVRVRYGKALTPSQVNTGDLPNPDIASDAIDAIDVPTNDGPDSAWNPFNGDPGKSTGLPCPSNTLGTRWWCRIGLGGEPDDSDWAIIIISEESSPVLFDTGTIGCSYNMGGKSIISSSSSTISSSSWWE